MPLPLVPVRGTNKVPHDIEEIFSSQGGQCVFGGTTIGSSAEISACLASSRALRASLSLVNLASRMFCWAKMQGAMSLLICESASSSSLIRFF